MTVRLGDKAPNFKAQTTYGAIDFYEWMGDDWVLFFSHPADFTPVCTTELGEVARLKAQFERRGVKVLSLSVDGMENHKRWLKDIEKIQGVKLNFPVIADPKRQVAEKFDMIQGNGNLMAAGRSTYVIDSEKVIRLIITYPESTGRNFEEILRAIDSLKLTTEFGVATPANWVRGDDVIILPSLSDKEARRRFPEGWEERTHYLRMVPDPMHRSAPRH
jgi:alkyl hydroperoxide reductase subunit AhpC